MSTPPENLQNSVLVAIPTYNEAANIEQITAELLEIPQIDLLIVDDNSPDGTGQIADRLAANFPRVKVLHRSEKQGLGPAYLAAFAWGQQAGYTWIVEMDADGSHRVKDLPKLLARRLEADQPDLVIGSRWVKGGRLENWPKTRKWLSQAGNSYIALCLGLGVKDATAGFRVYRLDFLATLELEEIDSKGYCFQTDMTRRIVRGGGKIAEVPITFCQRRAGQSKMSGSIIIESLLQVTKWAINDWRAKSGKTPGLKE